MVIKAWCLVLSVVLTIVKANYTVYDDRSYVIRSRNVVGSTKKLYENMLQGCQSLAKDDRCMHEEDFRIEMNVHQPPSVSNFTETGFTKIKCPQPLFQKLVEFWETNQDFSKVERAAATIFHNDHESPTHFLDIYNPSLKGGGPALAAEVFENVKELLQEWTGQRLAAASVYGIRTYFSKAFLAPHVDRLPLVASAIINVAQDVDEPWPLEVYGHQNANQAVNVTMEPGDMVLYESHSIIHGRPFPLKGRFFANLFVHFEVIGPMDADESFLMKDIPPYLIENSYWYHKWLKEHPNGWPLFQNAGEVTMRGDLEALKLVGKANPDALNAVSGKGWLPIHEACRQGRLDMLLYLVDNGADLHAKTNSGDTPIKVAIKYYGWGHELTRYIARRLIDEKDAGNFYKDSSRKVEERSMNYTSHDDASWAIKSTNVSTILGEEPKQRYERLITDCGNDLEGDFLRAAQYCEAQEDYRLFMNKYQPESVYNYTSDGFLKIRAPSAVFDLITEFWERNKDFSDIEWRQPTTHHNNLESPSRTVNIRNRTLWGGGTELQSAIADAAHSLMEEWSGQRLASSSIYGIRVYQNNSILTPHVDRLPLIVSAIINVAQDVDEPWPLEVYGHGNGGRAVNITMKPGDMVLYESHSVIHGRPFPMSGRYYANIFLHWEVLGPINNTQHNENDDLPPYLIPGSAMEEDWRMRNPRGWGALKDAFNPAKRGELRTIEHFAALRPSSLDITRAEGWKPFHEAIRYGRTDIVKFLLKRGEDLTSKARGMTPLQIAKRHLGDHEIVHLIETYIEYERNFQQSQVTTSDVRSEL